jgi:hypothetical protein
MPWSIDRIEKELLSGPASTVALPSETLVAAVNRVEQTLEPGGLSLRFLKSRDFPLRCD